eukprot:2017334-Rhodomonas_salina.1
MPGQGASGQAAAMRPRTSSQTRPPRKPRDTPSHKAARDTMTQSCSRWGGTDLRAMPLTASPVTSVQDRSEIDCAHSTAGIGVSVGHGLQAEGGQEEENEGRTRREGSADLELGA